VTIIRDGRAVETGTLAGLRHLTRVTVDAQTARPADLTGLPSVHDLVTDGLRVRCQVDQVALDAVLGRLRQAGVLALTCRPPTLEELFLRHYSAERSVAGAPR
jgi:ABC-2 type transport system ATP-binding protein